MTSLSHCPGHCLRLAGMPGDLFWQISLLFSGRSGVPSWSACGIPKAAQHAQEKCRKSMLMLLDFWQARRSSVVMVLCIALDSLDLQLHLPYSDWWQILFQWPNSNKVLLKLFLSRPHPLASVSCSKNLTKSVKWESPHPWYLTTLNIRSNSLFLSFNIWSPRSPSARILLCWFSKNAPTLEIFSTNLDISIHQLPTATHSTLRL